MKVTLKGTEYTVRNLEFDDVFKLAEILDKIDFDVADFQTDIAGLNAEGNAKVEQAGMITIAKMATHVLKKSHKAKKEFRNFLSSLIGVKPEAMGQMPIDAPIIILKEVAKEHDLLDFFKQATG